MDRYDVFTEHRERNLKEAFGVICGMTEEQLMAIDGLVPMTSKLFSGCMDACLKIGAGDTAFRLINEYREQAIEWADKQEMELENINIPDGLELELDSLRETLKEALLSAGTIDPLE